MALNKASNAHSMMNPLDLITKNNKTSVGVKRPKNSPSAMQINDRAVHFDWKHPSSKELFMRMSNSEPYVDHWEDHIAVSTVQILELKRRNQELESELLREKAKVAKLELELSSYRASYQLVADLKDALKQVHELREGAVKKKANRDLMSALGLEENGKEVVFHEPEVSIHLEENYKDDYLTQELLSTCTGETYQRYTSELLQLVFGREHLATHSLKGMKSSNASSDEVKPPLDSEKVEYIINLVQQKFPVSKSTVRAAIRVKLNNDHKRFKKYLGSEIVL